MNMLEAVKSVLSQYVGFGGRARRSEYWYWTLATILASVVVTTIEGASGLGSDSSGPFSSLLSLALFLPGLAVSFRRLHDTGRSGWWIGGFYLAMITIVIIVFTMALGTDGFGNEATGGLGSFALVFFIMLICGFAYAVAMLVFFVQDSQPGPNKYGPNPKNEGNFDVFG